MIQPEKFVILAESLVLQYTENNKYNIETPNDIDLGYVRDVDSANAMLFVQSV